MSATTTTANDLQREKESETVTTSVTMLESSNNTIDGSEEESVVSCPMMVIFVGDIMQLVTHVCIFFCFCFFAAYYSSLGSWDPALFPSCLLLRSVGVELLKPTNETFNLYHCVFTLSNASYPMGS